MNYNLLQKVARSSCILKSTYLIDKMMDARVQSGLNFCQRMGVTMPLNPRMTSMRTELNYQETEFLLLSKAGVDRLHTTCNILCLTFVFSGLSSGHDDPRFSSQAISQTRARRIRTFVWSMHFLFLRKRASARQHLLWFLSLPSSAQCRRRRTTR